MTMHGDRKFEVPPKIFMSNTRKAKGVVGDTLYVRLKH